MLLDMGAGVDTPLWACQAHHLARCNRCRVDSRVRAGVGGFMDFLVLKAG